MSELDKEQDQIQTVSTTSDTQSGTCSPSIGANGTSDDLPTDNALKFFVGGIHPDAWDEDLRLHFAQFGVVKEVQVMMDRESGRNRGFGFVTMEDSSLKETIFSALHLIKNKKLTVREMQPGGTSNLKRKVFIGGINPALNEEDLQPYFERFGAVEKVTVMRDIDGNSRGFGFVVYIDEEVCKKVVQHGVHYIDSENKVECRQAEARGRGPPPRGRARRAGEAGPDFDFVGDQSKVPMPYMPWSYGVGNMYLMGGMSPYHPYSSPHAGWGNAFSNQSGYGPSRSNFVGGGVRPLASSYRVAPY